MKPVKLKNLVIDPAGELYITAHGKLKRVAKTGKVYWVEGKEKLELTVLPLHNPKTRELIYQHLGPYRGARLGMPCDDL